MRLLDLFCGAGGCSVGYNRAGFDVTGVDLHPQKNYPFEFVQADAIEYVMMHGHKFDVIHASPPCQVHSVTKSLSNGRHIDLVPQTRAALIATGKPYIIENVPGAPLRNPLMLCGTMFGLGVIRHRLFECDPALWFPPAMCAHVGKATGNSMRVNGKRVTPSLKYGFAYVTVCGHDYFADEGRVAMGIDWTTRAELSQAIPPAYTEWLGGKFMELLL